MTFPQAVLPLDQVHRGLPSMYGGDLIIPTGGSLISLFSLISDPDHPQPRNLTDRRNCVAARAAILCGMALRRAPLLGRHPFFSTAGGAPTPPMAGPFPSLPPVIGGVRGLLHPAARWARGGAHLQLPTGSGHAPLDQRRAAPLINPPHHQM